MHTEQFIDSMVTSDFRPGFAFKKELLINNSVFNFEAMWVILFPFNRVYSKTLGILGENRKPPGFKWRFYGIDVAIFLNHTNMLLLCNLF